MGRWGHKAVQHQCYAPPLVAAYALIVSCRLLEGGLRSGLKTKTGCTGFYPVHPVFVWLSGRLTRMRGAAGRSQFAGFG